MAFRSLTRGLFQLATNRRLYSSVSNAIINRQLNWNRRQFLPFRAFSAVQTDDAYGDLSKFLDKEIKEEKKAQKNGSATPKVQSFEVQTAGPELTLTRQVGNDKVTVKLNVINTVNDSSAENEANANDAGQQSAEQPLQLKSRPSFTVDINRGGQTLSFSCSYLPHEYPEGTQPPEGDKSEQSEDFQIDEFAIHDGEWDDKVYSADCAIIDGDLYDKLLNLLEEYGIGEDFANELVNFSTAYEHQQYIGLLEKLQKFSKK